MTTQADRAPSGAEPPPRSIGGFRLLRRIGEGAMSDVFLGYDPIALKPVAVKVLGEHLSGQRQFIERFYREARMSKALDHPNMVRGVTHGYDAEARRHFLILEYVDGSNALALLQKHGPLPIALVARIGLEIGRALQYLHSRNYVHRDVKPENVLVAADGSARLGDLGLAKLLSVASDLSAVDEGVGTPHYMPYEQAVNGDLVDGRSDLFALGATLYHLATGHVPFSGDTHEEIVREKARNAYRPACTLRPDVPLELDQLLSRSLARDPQARFQSADELVAMLERTGLDRGPIDLPARDEAAESPGAAPPAARTHADLSVLPAEPAAAVKSGPPPCAFRRRGPIMIAVLLAGVLGVGGAWAALRNRLVPAAAPPDFITAPAANVGPSAGLPEPEYNKPSGPAAGG